MSPHFGCFSIIVVYLCKTSSVFTVFFKISIFEKQQSCYIENLNHQKLTILLMFSYVTGTYSVFFTGMGLLSVAVVGDVFEQALEQDDNGSVYAIMPGLPPLKMPNWNPILIAPTAIMAKLLGSNKPFDAKNALMGGILIMLILSFFAGFVMSYIFF